MGQLIVIVAMLVLAWLLLIRPARRRQVAQQQLHAGLEPGDEILTAGGIFGRVRALQGEDELLVEFAPNVELRVARRAVAAVIPPDAESEQLEPEEAEEIEEVDGAEAEVASTNPNTTAGDRG